VRIGWSLAAPAAAPAVARPADPAAAGIRALRERRRYRRPLPAAPLARIACDFAGPPVGIRLPDSFGFGVTPAPVPRTPGVTRVGTMGSLLLPWSGSQPLTSGGDADLAWVAPLDPAARIRRLSIPMSSGLLGGLAHRPYEAFISHVLDRAGRVTPIAAGPSNTCLAALLDHAGATRPLGGCAPQRSVGVEIEGRVLLLTSDHRGQVVTAADLGADAGARPLVQRQLNTQPVAQTGAQRHAHGAGARAGAPVFVAVGGRGDAVLVPVDPERGTFGAEERLASLRELRAGSDPGCASRPGEARVLLPFDTEIGLVPGSLPGVTASGAAGLAVIRWSAAAACLDAVELTVRDERYEPDVGFYDPPGTVKKIVARFAGPPPIWRSDRGAAPPDAGPPPHAGAGAGALVLLLQGQEIRQPIACRSAAP
jgi:hypothetical protein